MDLARASEIHLGLDLNEELMERSDVDDQPTPIVKLPQACEYAQLLSNFVVEHPLDFKSVLDMTNMQSFMNKLNKMSISNTNKHHHNTRDFTYVIYGEESSCNCNFKPYHVML